MRNKKRVLILTDNEYIYLQLKKIFREECADLCTPTFMYSIANIHFKFSKEIECIDIKKAAERLTRYDLIISAHCKQIFPIELLRNVRCINVHPGFNPDNRGWYPQIFSILNGKKIGATIHEIDEQLDHGPIIVQKEIKIRSWDTSESLYKRVVKVEIELFRRNIRKIVEGKYTTFKPKEGNLNLKKDFLGLCKLDLKEKKSMQEFINLLRALTHANHKNAFFVDGDGNKIYVRLILKKSNND